MPQWRLPRPAVTIPPTLRWILIGSVIGAFSGALISFSIPLFLIIGSIVGAWYLIITSKLQLSRPLAYTVAFLLLIGAIFIIYFDQPSAKSLRPDELRFSLAIVDSEMLSGMRLGRPRIKLNSGMAEWSGEVTISGERDDKTRTIKQRRAKFVVLLPRTAKFLSDATIPSNACVKRSGETPGLVLECTVEIRESKYFALYVKFNWQPHMTRLRIGEKLLTLIRSDPQLWRLGDPLPKVDKNHPPPVVEVWNNPGQIDLRDPHPEVYIALQNAVAWRMDSLDMHQQDYLDVIVVNRRLRFLADQAPNILGVGAGLLLGLLAQPLQEGNGRVRQRRQAETETSSHPATDRS